MSFNFNEHQIIEEEVSDRPGSYRKLLPEALYTSSEDFDAIFSNPLVQGTFVDLGCGTGLGCLQYAERFPDRFSVGVDLEKARVDYGLKLITALGLKNVALKVSDLLSDPVPVGDTYFLYFPTGHVLDKILTELYGLMKSFTLVVIESHGDLLPRLEIESWLKLKAEVSLTSQRLYPFARIYKSCSDQRKIPEAYQVSFKNLELFIEDETGVWLGDSFGLQFEKDKSYTLKHPPRTIHWESVKTLKAIYELGEALQQLVEFRRSGTVRIVTFERSYHGLIRKIYISPVFGVEISTGERVEWSNIIKITTGT